jgi:hypothetical protein
MYGRGQLSRRMHTLIVRRAVRYCRVCAHDSPSYGSTDCSRLRGTVFAATEVPFWRGRTFADAADLSWRSVPGNGRQIADSGAVAGCLGRAWC